MSVQTEVQTSDVTVNRVDWAPVPRVNLLPAEILDAREFRKVQVRLVLAVAFVVCLAVGGVVWGQSQVNSAQAALDQTSAETTVLEGQEARYAEVPRLTAAVASAKAAREQVLGQDVLWYRLLSDVALAAPSNVWLTTLSVNLTGTAAATSSTGAAAASSTDALSPAGIGTLSVTGKAESYPDVSAWLESIGRVNGLQASTLQNITRESASAGATGPPLQFTSQVVVSSASLSHRYDRKAR